MRLTFGLLLLVGLGLIVPSPALADEAIEELPPPSSERREPAGPRLNQPIRNLDDVRDDARDDDGDAGREDSVLVNVPPAESAPAKGSSSAAAIASWGLSGPLGRHYSVGNAALADYWRDGQRQLATLTVEDPASHASRDDNFLYFREDEQNHRWAIARLPSADGRYRIYFQAADERGVWRLFQRADANWNVPRESVLTSAPNISWPVVEPTEPESVWSVPAPRQPLLPKLPWHRPERTCGSER